MVESEGEHLIWFSEQLDIAKSHFKPFLRIREGAMAAKGILAGWFGRKVSGNRY
jgi:hypothetical protein